MRQRQLQIALCNKKKKQNTLKKRKNIEKLMAKFENYANQSAAMGVRGGERKI